MTEMTTSEFHDALKATNRGYTALSWGGHNIFGSKADIDHVKQLIDLAAQREYYRRLYLAAQGVEPAEARVQNLLQVYYTTYNPPRQR